MKRPLVLMFGISMIVIVKIHCSENIAPVVNRMVDLNNEVFKMKMSLARVEEKVKNQIDLAKLSIGIDLDQNLKQHVREAMAEILKDQSIDELVTSQTVSEVQQLKRENKEIKRQLHQVMESVKGVQKERDELEEALEEAQQKSSEVKCVMSTDASIGETIISVSFRKRPLQIDNLVSNLTEEIQSIRMEQNVLNESVNAVEKDLYLARSVMDMNQASVNVTRGEMLSLKSELGQLKVSLINAEQDILSTRSEMDMNEALVNVTRDDVLSLKSNLTQLQADVINKEQLILLIESETQRNKDWMLAEVFDVRSGLMEVRAVLNNVSIVGLQQDYILQGREIEQIKGEGKEYKASLEDIKEQLSRGQCQTGMAWFYPWPRADKSASENLMITKNISFARPFNTPPVISVGLNNLDVFSDRNIKVDCQPYTIQKTSFQITCIAWGNTQLYEVKTSWIACKNPGTGPVG